MQTLTRDQVRQVDRLAIDELGIPGVVLMENAGRNAADAVIEMLRSRRESDDPAGSRVAVVCGSGNNGGDGYVVARHLHNAGVQVTAHPAKDPQQLTGDAEVNFKIVQRMGLSIVPVADPASLAQAQTAWQGADVIVDALMGTGGTGFAGQVRPEMVRIIEACNAARSTGTAIVAIDVPSGLDCDTGLPARPTIIADLTVTFVAMKCGFGRPEAQKYTGRVIVADIGAPSVLIDRVLHTDD